MDAIMSNPLAAAAFLLSAVALLLTSSVLYGRRADEARMKVELTERLGQATRARIWHDGRLIFDGETKDRIVGGYRRLGDALPIVRPLAPCSTYIWKDPLMLRCGVSCHTHGVIYTSQPARLHTQQELEQIADKHREDARRSDEG